MDSLQNFLEELYGSEEGVVYSPHIKGGRFYQNFFKWPSEREKLLTHLADNLKRDVYISPSLFTKEVIHPDTFKGTRFVWTEFDGKLPKETPPVTPSIRVQSSNAGYEHWYWRLDNFETDANRITEVTKRLAYALEADLSSWDYAQILRPPNTLNNKYSEPKPVQIKESNGLTYSLEAFDILPRPPQQVDISINQSSLPEIQKLVATYSWTPDAFDLFTKKLEKGKRSDQLSRLAFELAEMGMSNEEMFAILQDADKRCKKFHGRTDATRRLMGLISHVRSKKAVALEITDKSTVYRFNDFMNTEIKLKWVIPGVLPVAGSAVIFGPSTVGKSTFALRAGMQIACGESQFLGFPIERKQKVLFLSLEMPHDELKFFMSQMQIPAQKAAMLQENFFVWPVGHPYPLDTRDQQIEVLNYIDRYGIELIIIDSLGVATYGSISNQDDMKRLFSFVNEDLRAARGCGYMFIHHPRKPGSGESKKPMDFNDAYGDSYIINNAQSVILLNTVSANKLKVSLPKSRLTKDAQDFYVTRTNNRDYELVATPPSKEEELDKEIDAVPGILDLGKNFARNEGGKTAPRQRRND